MTWHAGGVRHPRAGKCGRSGDGGNLRESIRNSRVHHGAVGAVVL